MVGQHRLGEFVDTQSGNEKELELPEHQLVEHDDIPYQVGNYIHENYNTEIEVTFPSPKTDGAWQFENKGYAGRLELIGGWSVSLKPKIEVDSIFRMLEEVYEIESFDLLEGSTQAGSIDDVFERVVGILVKKVADRERQGLYKSYVSKSERSNSIRGRIDLREASKRPWDPKLPIEYDELTVDNEENQILLWAIFQALSAGIEDDELHKQARELYRNLVNQISLKRFEERDCSNRRYGRDNHDYELLHSLCRVILGNMGPTINRGDNRIVPFRVEMPTLFERFVANKMEEHLPSDFELTSQHVCELGNDKNWNVDIVVHKGPIEDGNILFIADTKYSTTSSTAKPLPRPSSISQVVSYATALDAEDAFLIYPEALESGFNQKIGDVRVRTLSLGARDDYNRTFQTLLNNIFIGMGMPRLSG